MQTRQATATINLLALNQNIVALKSCLQPKTKFMAVIKANAYGHGAVAIAKYLEKTKSADYLGVACLFEVMQLRQNGIKTPILNFGALSDQDLPSVFELDFTPTIFDFETAQKLSQMARNYQEIVKNDENEAKNNENLPKSNKNPAKTLKIHIKINTGMNRLGVDFETAPEIIAKIANLPNIEIEGIYSHLACADEPSNSFTQTQILRFENVIKELAQKNIKPQIKHLANSAGILFHKNSHFDMVRAGIALYGYLTNNSVNFSQKFPLNSKKFGKKITILQKILKKFSRKLHLPVILEPILELKTKITQIREIKKGEGVSYSHKFIAKKPAKIATLAIGYGDGLARILQKKLQVIVCTSCKKDEAGEEKFAKIIGRICMDQMMIDVSNIKNAKIGDEVIIFRSFSKKNIDFNEKNAKIEENAASARELAIMLNTIPYEVLTALSVRVERVYVE